MVSSRRERVNRKGVTVFSIGFMGDANLKKTKIQGQKEMLTGSVTCWFSSDGKTGGCSGLMK